MEIFRISISMIRKIYDTIDIKGLVWRRRCGLIIAYGVVIFVKHSSCYKIGRGIMISKRKHHRNAVDLKSV